MAMGYISNDGRKPLLATACFLCFLLVLGPQTAAEARPLGGVDGLLLQGGDAFLLQILKGSVPSSGKSCGTYGSAGCRR